jgi:hypothetical protein
MGGEPEPTPTPSDPRPRPGPTWILRVERAVDEGLLPWASRGDGETLVLVAPGGTWVPIRRVFLRGRGQRVARARHGGRARTSAAPFLLSAPIAAPALVNPEVGLELRGRDGVRSRPLSLPTQTRISAQPTSLIQSDPISSCRSYLAQPCGIGLSPPWIRTSCHAEGRGFESLHPLLLNPLKMSGLVVAAPVVVLEAPDRVLGIGRTRSGPFPRWRWHSRLRTSLRADVDPDLARGPAARRARPRPPLANRPTGRGGLRRRLRCEAGAVGRRPPHCPRADRAWLPTRAGARDPRIEQRHQPSPRDAQCPAPPVRQ